MQRLKTSLKEREEELDDARSDSQRLKEMIANVESESKDFTAKADLEIRRLNEAINMANKELEDQRQHSYDRESCARLRWQRENPTSFR